MNKYSISTDALRLLAASLLLPIPIAAVRNFLMYYPPLGKKDEDSDVTELVPVVLKQEPEKAPKKKKTRTKAAGIANAIIQDPLISILALGPVPAFSLWAANRFFEQLATGYVTKQRQKEQEKYESTLKTLLQLLALKRETQQPGIVLGNLPKKYQKRLERSLEKELKKEGGFLGTAKLFLTAPIFLPFFTSAQILTNRWMELRPPKMSLVDLIKKEEAELEARLANPSMHDLEDELFLRKLEKEIEETIQGARGGLKIQLQEREAPETDIEIEEEQPAPAKTMEEVKKELIKEQLQPKTIKRRGVTIITS